MARRTVFYRRRFLNRPRHHGGAYVLATVERCTKDGCTEHIDASVVIADCSTAITLDLDGYDAAERANSLHKARLLRDALVDFCGALETAFDSIPAAGKGRRS